MGGTDGNRGVETVVFDIGNVLVDWNPRYLYRKMFSDEAEMEKFLETVVTHEWNREQDRGRTIEEANEHLISLHPHYETEIEAFYGRWGEMLGGPIEGSVEVLRELDESGYPLFALTNWSAETFPLSRELYPFLDTFDDIVVSGEVGLIKPDPEIFDLLTERTGLDPQTSVFIDDSIANVLTARHLGFEGVLFEGAGGLREDLSRLGVLGNGGQSRESGAAT